MRREVITGHCHDSDPTILTNGQIEFMDDLVTGRGCNIQPMEVL